MSRQDRQGTIREGAVVEQGERLFERTPCGDYRHGGSTLLELLVPMTLWLPDERA